MKAERKAATCLAAAILAVSLVGACDYIVPPVEFGTPTPVVVDKGWAGIVTGVSDSGGSLHVDLSIVNNTSQWSAMDVGATTARVGGQSCSKAFVGTAVFVNSGGWYLPPGFVMSGYTGGTYMEPKVQKLYVECAGVAKAAGQTLSVTYEYITGPFNYYIASKPVTKTMELSLDKVVTDTKYPVAAKVPGLPMPKTGEAITGINDCTLTLTKVARTDSGLTFTWHSKNPTKDVVWVHIGNPPVIGSDGILYGFYQSPHLADPPVTPASGEADWTTTASVPQSVVGLYILLPLETRQAKYFVDHVVDITNL